MLPLGRENLTDLGRQVLLLSALRKLLQNAAGIFFDPNKVNCQNIPAIECVHKLKMQI